MLLINMLEQFNFSCKTYIFVYEKPGFIQIIDVSKEEIIPFPRILKNTRNFFNVKLTAPPYEYKLKMPFKNRTRILFCFIDSFFQYLCDIYRFFVQHRDIKGFFNENFLSDTRWR